MAYDPATDDWTAFPQPPESLWPNRGAMVWTGDELLVWGVGRVDDTDAVGARLDLDSGTWRSLADDPLPPIDWFEGTPGSQSAVWTGEEMVVWTGALGAVPWDEDPTPVLAYDPATDRWRELPSAPDTTWFHPALVWTGDAVLAVTDRVLAIRP
jgi:hypothetical protein